MPDISVDLEQFRARTSKQVRLDQRPLQDENRTLQAICASLKNELQQAHTARSELTLVNEDLQALVDDA